MGFSTINPNQYYLKLMFIVKSVDSIRHFEMAERCIDLYDAKRDYFVDYFKESSDKPIVAHTGEYDHETAVWIMRKKLNYKKQNL